MASATDQTYLSKLLTLKKEKRWSWRIPRRSWLRRRHPYLNAEMRGGGTYRQLLFLFAELNRSAMLNTGYDRAVRDLNLPWRRARGLSESAAALHCSLWNIPLKALRDTESLFDSFQRRNTLKKKKVDMVQLSVKRCVLRPASAGFFRLCTY